MQSLALEGNRARNPLEGGILGFRPFVISALVAVVTTVAALPCALRGLAPLKLQTVRDIRSLRPEQASQAVPVHLRGVVTVLSGWKSSFFFQDKTFGISVDRTGDLPVLHQGQSVDIRGVTGAGMFAPVVAAQSVTVLGEGQLPPAPLADMNKLAGGKQDSQWLTIRGIVRSATVKRAWGRLVLFLEVDIGGGGLVTVRVHDFSEDGLDRLQAATVSVRGVCGTVFNDKRQFIGLRLFVSDLKDVKVERAAPADPFAIPLSGLDSLLQFSDHEGVINRIKVRGVVTWSEPGQGLYLQKGTQGVFIQGAQAASVPPGTRLEVVGYPAIGRYSPKLDDATFRVIGSELEPVAYSPQTAAEMIVMKDGFSSAPYDSMLVQLKARLVDEMRGSDEDVLLLKDGASVFTAKLAHLGSQGPEHIAPAPGSLLSITGICLAKADESHEASSFQILLRSPADLVVLERAQWWTTSHALWVVILLTLVVLVMAGWLAIVRRQATLRALTVTDALTGLYNRRGFLLLAEQQWQLAMRRGIPLLIFYIDVNRFKEINDSLGHKEGDLALQACAAVLRECFRKSDVLGRLGGDEFAITAFDAADSSQAMLEQRLARLLAQTNKKVGRLFQLSFSVGVLACGERLKDLTIEDLLAKSDALMYQQKRKGRPREPVNLSGYKDLSTD